MNHEISYREIVEIAHNSIDLLKESFEKNGQVKTGLALLHNALSILIHAGIDQENLRDICNELSKKMAAVFEDFQKDREREETPVNDTALSKDVMEIINKARGTK